MKSQETVESYLDAVRNTRSYGDSFALPPRVGDSFDMLKQCNRLDQQSGFLQRANVAASSSAEGIKAAVQEIQRLATALKAYLVSEVGWNPLLTAPTARSSELALQVFSILELLEMIILSLSTEDFLEVPSTSKVFAGAICASPKLQIKLGLRPSANSLWRTNFNRAMNPNHESDRQVLLHDCIQCYITDTLETESEGEDDSSMLIRAKFSNRYRWDSRKKRKQRDPLIQMGERCRSMLICQPPIAEMLILPSCCRVPYERSGEPKSVGVRNVSGLTVGNLLDAANEAKNDHRLCTHARLEQHDLETADVNPEVQFEGMLQLRPDDPMLPQNEVTGESVDGNDVDELSASGNDVDIV